MTTRRQAMGRSIAPFMVQLARHRRVWRRGLMLQRALCLAGVAMVGLALYGLFDYFLPVAAPVRRWINIVGASGLAAAAAYGLLRIARLSLHATACRLDRLCHDRRRSAQTACELLHTGAAASGFHSFLVARSVNEADEKVAQLPVSLSLPAAGLRRQARVLGVQVAALLLLVALNPPASRVIVMRILRPALDAPPYSRYVFQVEPDEARVTYGGHIELTAHITGAPLRAPVWLLTRDHVRQHRTACFQEADSRFSQRLDHVVAPLEFAFATGRARSAWQPVQLLLQPRVAAAALAISPPAYSRLPERRFEAGSQPLQGLRGSRITLTLTSNRPLLDGHAVIRPRDDPAAEQVVAGRRQDAHTMQFEWILADVADVEVDLRDIQGTSSAVPFRLHQQRLPDEPPVVVLHEPQPFSLATPDARLTLRGDATDDLGLQQVELVKALVGYRDRMQVLGPPAPATRFAIHHDLDLSMLGVQPGEVLEFYAEALDTHPGIPNLAASGIARVQIISEDEYAEMLRTEITLREFMQRYQAVESAMNHLRDDLAALMQAEASEQQDALDATIASAEAAERLLNQLARDVLVFDMEKAFFDELQTIGKTVAQARQELGATSTADPRLGALARHWHEQIAPAAEAVAAHREQAQVAAEIAALMEAAVRFRQIVQRQESLVRILARYELEGGDGGRLRALGDRQAEIERDLGDVLATIERNAPLLTGEAAAFAATATQFARQLQAADPVTPMRAAVLAAENSDGRTTHHQAVLALERLRQAGAECEGDGGFGAMCRGQGPPRFGSDALQNTLAQMLAAMMQRLLGGQGGEGPTPSQGFGWSGLGLGGGATDGYWMTGHTPLNVPVAGPPRTRFTAASFGASGDSGAGGQAGRPVVSAGAAVRAATPAAGVDSRTMPLESVPRRYREAVRRYFSNGE